MPRRFLNRSSFSEQTPIVDGKPLKNICIDESRNLMQMILDIKLEAELQARSQRQMKTKDFIKKEEDNILKPQKKLNFDIQDPRISLAAKSFQLKGKRIIEKMIKYEYDEDETAVYPNLLEALLKRMISSAQSVKRNIKRVKGLQVDKEFIFKNVHQCEYCGRKFPKPCALGGHISKLHSQERRKDAKKMADNFDSQIAEVQ